MFSSGLYLFNKIRGEKGLAEFCILIWRTFPLVHIFHYDSVFSSVFISHECVGQYVCSKVKNIYHNLV